MPARCPRHQPYAPLTFALIMGLVPGRRVNSQKWQIPPWPLTNVYTLGGHQGLVQNVKRKVIFWGASANFYRKPVLERYVQATARCPVDALHVAECPAGFYRKHSLNFLERHLQATHRCLNVSSTSSFSNSWGDCTISAVTARSPLENGLIFGLSHGHPKL